MAAKWFGVAPWDLLAQEDWQAWVEVGMLLKSIEAEESERARKKG